MAHKYMKLRKRHKRFKYKFVVYVLVMYLSFSYTFYYSLKHTKRISNEEFINLLVRGGNANILDRYKLPNIVNSTMKVLFRIDFTHPASIFNSSVFRYGKVDNKVINLEYSDDYSNMEELKEISDYINDPNPKNADSPIVYLYNSHQLENYSNEKLDVYGITPNVMMATYVLREKLIEYGISSIVEEANIGDILNANGWNYAYSYQASRIVLEEKKRQYNSLKYFIDIHRDSIGRSGTVVTINNINYARVLFVVGLDYTGWEANYQFALKLNNSIESEFPGLSRGIMKKTGMNVNGVYNQDFSPNCILIEVGGVSNNIDEVNQTMNVLAKIISKYVKENS